MLVYLLRHAQTPVAAERFGVDEQLSARGLQDATECTTPSALECYSAPSAACRQTAEALGISATVEESAASCDFGVWHGSTVDEILAIDHEAVSRWLTEPHSAPHHGETLAALVKRASQWLIGLSASSTLLIADDTFLRAAVVAAMAATPHIYWRLQTQPLSLITLSGARDRWTIQF